MSKIDYSHSKQKFILTFSFTLFISALILFVMTTFAGLSSSKQAVGSITFDFDSPAITLDNRLDLYYTNSGLTYGSDTSAGTSIASIEPLNMSIDAENIFESYFVKVEYEFSGITSGVSFGASTYSYGTATMSAMSKVSGSTYKFASQSTTAVAKGTTFDLLQYLKNFKYTGESDYITNTPITYKIIITADISNGFDTTSRSQTSLSGTMGMSYNAQPTVTAPSTLNNLLITNTYLDDALQSSVGNANISLTLSDISTYVKLKVTTTSPLYAVGSQTSSDTSWNYATTTTSTATTIEITSKNKIAYTNNSSTIDLTTLLTTAPVGAYNGDLSNINANLVV